MALWRSEHPGFKPYWDPTLAASRSKRIELYKTLHGKGLLVLRRRIHARCGIFFVWKSGRKGIRLIIDARESNGYHRRPPKAYLGSGGAIAEMQIDSAFGGFAEVSVPVGEDGSSVAFGRREFWRLDGATGDVSDAFYQFSVEHMAEWFGLDDAIFPWELGLDGVDSGVKHYPCFCGMPQGWPWALFFCNAAL